VNTTLRLQQVFREVFDDDDIVITDATTARDIPDWDSLAHVSLIVAVEQEFSVRFASSDVGGLKNVGELRQLIERNIAG
jgi:acyl carrier protein